ncbi:MAG: HNH endonuclease [Candidatus Rokubacteria bacterium]|nr:HNH endonuclease [Candidatus Rokubacteria bacterium]
MATSDLDSRVRAAAFEFLAEQTRLHGEVLARETLSRGFDFDGTRVPLVGPQGIFKPSVLADMPLTITTAPTVEGRERPYEDRVEEGGVILYRYRGTDPRHPDNVGLRRAMQRETPLVYLYGLVPGRYLPVWPVYIVGDDPQARAFKVAVDDARLLHLGSRIEEAVETEARRRYITRSTRQRLHQQSFRQRVLAAYQQCCAICRLRHEELLEAAHILPDGHPRGEPVVPNGLALCTLHHAAFDGHLLGIRPDLQVQVKPAILREPDGPMLRHGLQGFHGARIRIPRSAVLQPNRDFLAERYEWFRKAV